MTSTPFEPAPLPDSCSVQWQDGGLPAAGSAPAARFWVALEQSGPWGHDAIADSHLSLEVGGALERAAQAAGGRLLLIRRPGQHADQHAPDAPANVLIAGGPSSDPWLLEGEIDDPAQLLRLPWPLLLEDDPDSITEYLPELEETRTPHLLVCTNGKRDVCCAVRGRPVAHGAAARYPDQVWECSHTGGHRFAPTGILLPYGQVYARLTTALAVDALELAGSGQMPSALNNATHNRGFSRLPAAGQAADVAVREAIGEPSLTALDVQPGDDDSTFVISHRHDGRRWQAQVEHATGPDLKSSCAKLPKPSHSWSVNLQ